MRKFIFIGFMMLMSMNVYGFNDPACSPDSPPDGFYSVNDNLYPWPDNAVEWKGDSYLYPFRDDYWAVPSGSDLFYPYYCNNYLLCADGYFMTGNPAFGTMECHPCSDAAACPEGTIAPKCDAGYYYSDSIQGCDECGAAFWCPGDNVRNSCGAGKTTNTKTAQSADECRPLCSFGVTEMHADGYVFNMWRNDECASPAIRVGFGGDGVCCVKLESGAGRGINVNIDNATYHTVN